MRHSYPLRSIASLTNNNIHSEHLEEEQEPMIDLTSQPQHDASSTHKQKKSHYSFDRVFLKRLYRLLQVLFRSTSNQDRFYSLSPKARQHSIFWLYIAFIAISCGTEILYYYVGLMPSRFYGVLSSKDFPGFTRFILPCIILVFGAAAVSFD